MMTTIAKNDEHTEWLERVERLFTGHLGAEDSAAVYAHVKSCSSCERAYSELAEAEKALFSGGAGRALSPLARDRVRDRLFAAKPEAQEKPSILPAFVWQHFGKLSGAALAALVLAFHFATTPDLTGRGQDELTARSGGAAVAAGMTLRALAVREGDGGFDVVELGTSGKLAIGEHVKLLATSVDAARWVTVAIVDRSGRELVRLGPEELAKGTQDRGLGRAVPVDADWPTGQVRVVALFTDAPTDGSISLADLAASDAPGQSVRVLELELVPAVRGGAR